PRGRGVEGPREKPPPARSPAQFTPALVPCPLLSLAPLPLRSSEHPLAPRPYRALRARTQEFTEQVALWVTVPEVLAEGLGVGDAGLRARVRRPLPHCLDVLVHAVLPTQPLALAGVRCQHLPLRLDHRRDVHMQARRYVLAHRPLALNWVAIIQMRNMVQGW